MNRLEECKRAFNNTRIDQYSNVYHSLPIEIIKKIQYLISVAEAAENMFSQQCCNCCNIGLCIESRKFREALEGE